MAEEQTERSADSAPITDSAAQTSIVPKARSASITVTPREPVSVDLRSLLEAGVHFGHQTSRWSPTMAPYIYGTRNGIHIINLPKTIQCWKTAYEAVVSTVAEGGTVLFVGTKKQAQEAVQEEAMRCGAFYVSQRWLGGMMTNFQTIRRSVDRMRKVEEILAEEEQALKQGTAPKYTKKERLMMARELEKLDFSLGGIRDMTTAPSLLFVVDIKREDIAVKEAHRLDIPVVALVDTNCDPNQVTYPIPSNDDGTRAVRLFCAAVADAVQEGKRRLASRPARQRDKGDMRGGREFFGGEAGEGEETRHGRHQKRQSERAEKEAPAAGTEESAPAQPNEMHDA